MTIEEVLDLLRSRTRHFREMESQILFYDMADITAIYALKRSALESIIEEIERRTKH